MSVHVQGHTAVANQHCKLKLRRPMLLSYRGHIVMELALLISRFSMIFGGSQARAEKLVVETKVWLGFNWWNCNYIICYVGGVDPSTPAYQIKKAYRKAALKYHPDKAGQSLVRN